MINLNTKLKNKIFFNYNFQVSNFKESLKKLINNKKNGKTNYVSISVSHGIAFNKKKFANWRKKQENIFDNIIGNLGIHYIELMVSLYGKIKSIKIIHKNNSNTKSLDTGFVSIEFKKDIIVNMYLSYARTFEQSINFYLTNSIIKVANNEINYFSPRDTYDKSGKFCIPKLQKKILLKDMQYDSLVSSIVFFKNIIKVNKKIKISSFDSCLYVNKILLDNSLSFKKYNNKL